MRPAPSSGPRSTGRPLSASRIRLALGLVLGLGLLAWFVATTEWHAFLHALSGLRLGYVALAASVLLLEFVLRAIRWRILLRPICPQAGIGALFSATVIGAAVNTLLPARAGEVARPLVAVRRTGAPLAATVTTTVVERMFDLVGLLSVFLLMLVVLPQVDGPEGVLVRNLRRYGTLMGVAGVVGLAVLAFGSRRRERLHGWLAALTRLLPGRLARPVLRVLDGLVDGMTALSRPRDAILALLCTLALWMNGVLSIVILMAAFRIDLPLGAAAFTSVAIALTVVLPQAPGFVGVFHVAIEKTLVLWGLDTAPAKGFAMVFWGISFLPVTCIGLLALWREGLSIGEVLTRPRSGPTS
jgi:glycosyltransferase 2 family protein